MPFLRSHPLSIARSILVLALLIVSAPARADMEGAMVAYRAGDHAAALAQFRPLAARGDPEAEFMLGALYFYGQGVPRNLAIASLWFYKSALQGHPSAQLALGSLHIQGDGVGQDLVKAYKWLQLAADSHVAALVPHAVQLRSQAAQYMTAAQIAQAGSLAAHWRPTPAGFIR